MGKKPWKKLPVEPPAEPKQEPPPPPKLQRLAWRQNTMQPWRYSK